MWHMCRFARQVRVLLHRSLQIQLRNPSDAAARILLCLWTGIITGALGGLCLPNKQWLICRTNALHCINALQPCSGYAAKHRHRVFEASLLLLLALKVCPVLARKFNSCLCALQTWKD